MRYLSSDVISLADASFPPASTSSTVGGAAAGAVATAAFASAPVSPAAPSSSVRASSASLGGAIGAGEAAPAAARRHSRRVVGGAMPSCQLSLQSWRTTAGTNAQEKHVTAGKGGNANKLPVCQDVAEPRLQGGGRLLVLMCTAGQDGSNARDSTLA